MLVSRALSCLSGSTWPKQAVHAGMGSALSRTALLFKCTLSSDPWQVLGLTHGASKQQVKSAYYELAKRTHPDGQTGGDSDHAPEPDAAAFLEVQAAFDEVMDLIKNAERTVAQPTAPNHSSRSGTPSQRPSYQRKPRASQRIRTLGEVLCDQLVDEPARVQAVWSDIKEQRLEVNVHMSDSLARACGTSGKGMSFALDILQEGTRHGLMSQQVRSLTIASILCHCKEDDLDVTFELVSQIKDEDRTPEVLSALSSTFSFFPSGASF